MSQRFAPDIRAEVDRFVGTGPDDTIDFEAAETAVRRSALRLAARAVEQRLDADLSDHCGPFRPCPNCVQLARYAGRRPKTFETVLGPLTLQRAYYHCPVCGTGCCPRDAALGLDRSSLSPGVLRMTGSTAASRDTDREPSVFAQRVRREAERRGFPQAERRVVLGDGALWIWKIAGEDYPGAIQIVDLFHAREHLHDVSKALFPGDSDRARLWADVRCDELDDGCLDDVLAVLRSHATGSEEAAQCAEYIEHNRERMQYANFRERGLCVASGVVESGCKTALGTRLKRSGMHWTVEGANAIAALRCCILSGLYEDFWAYRTART